MGKILEYGDEARARIFSGVSKLARTVRVTMGPRGRCVIIGREIGAPSITKDGVSVAREVVLDDPLEELGCQLVKEAAGRTAAVAGDGTTTATVLTHAILSEGEELINSGYNPIAFRNGMDWAKASLINTIGKLSHPLDTDDDLKNIATISVNGDSLLGDAISDAFIKVDRNGLVTAEAKPGVQTSVRVVDGVELGSGYISPVFLNKGEGSRKMLESNILILDFDVTTYAEDDFIRMVQMIGEQKKPTLIVCNDLQKEGFNFFASNFKAGRLDLCCVRTPKFGAHQSKWLEDLAMLTSSTIMGGSHGVGIKDFTLDCLGYADRIVVNSHKTIITEPKKLEPVIKERADLYREQMDHLIGDSERFDIKNRLAFLSGSASVITVGYNTELELREKGDRVEDAIFAVKAAIEEGYVVGGGFALWHASKLVESMMDAELPKDEHRAAMVLLEAVKAPARQIISNAGLDPENILKEIECGSDIGYNTATGKYENLIESGVIDPKKVTRTALENAASIAQLLLTTDAVIADNPRNPTGWSPPAAYRMPSKDGLDHKY